MSDNLWFSDVFRSIHKAFIKPFEEPQSQKKRSHKKLVSEKKIKVNAESDIKIIIKSDLEKAK